jgi:hypothetical protein
VHEIAVVENDFVPLEHGFNLVNPVGLDRPESEVARGWPDLASGTGILIMAVESRA